MAKPSKKTPDKKLRMVLSVLRGAHLAETARRNGAPEESVHDWESQVLDVGRKRLAKRTR